DVADEISQLGVDEIVNKIQTQANIIGRTRELHQIILARLANKHVIIEGPVGVGKTTIAQAITEFFSQDFIRIDGDERYTEAKLVGHFEPPLVIEKGWTWEAFVPGPLTDSMIKGSVLFINEANRLIEGTQNVLLPALDEHIIHIPKLGTINAKNGFFVVATQNPEAYIGTTVLSEALKDRFVWVRLDWQNIEEEISIVEAKINGKNEQTKQIAEFASKVIRATRNHPNIRRGASIRGAIDLAKIVNIIKSMKLDDLKEIAVMTLATKIELEDGIETSIETVIKEIVERIYSGEDHDFFGLPPG
ncbi:MAG: AAA family ATPase, partial [Candidatus Hodarchaeota archaeon]